jgi:DNA-binding Lrp family transcriptional regulator
MFDPDRIDFAILEHLQNNARLSNKELAALVGLAPSTCLERTRRLTREGVLEGFHARVADEALGIGVHAMIEVSLKIHSRETVEAFSEYALGEVDEVVELFHVTGEQDFFMHVAVRDADHLRDLLLDHFTTLPEVARLQTHIVFSHRRHPARPVLARKLD